MHIGIVLKTFPPDVIGGMETQTKRMATELQERGHDVTVFTKRFGEHDDTDVPYEVVRVPNWSRSPFFSDLTFLVACLLAVVWRSREFDCLQCMMLYPTGFLGYVANRLTGVPYFAWIRGGDYYLMNDVWWKRWMMKRVLSDTLVLAQSGEILEDVLEDFGESVRRIEVLGNGVTVPETPAGGEEILYVGRLAPKKGVENLLRAVSAVRPDRRLLVVGDGERRERLETLAAELGIDVRFEGFVDPEEVDRFYRRAAVLVLPSVEGEGLPNVVLEAMARGIPVIATESGGTRAAVRDGETGLLVPVDDVDALADALQAILEDETLRAELGSNGREFVAETFSWDAIVAELESIYRRLSGSETVSE